VPSLASLRWIRVERAAAQSDKPPIAEKRVKTPRKQPQEREKEGFTAWGKEVGSLQAGLGYHPGQKRAYSHGETVRLIVRVRNVSKEAVKFQYLRQFFIERPPAVTDGAGKPVLLGGVTAFGFHIPVDVNLLPGQEIELYEWKLELKGASEGSNERFSTLYGAGKFQIQYERVLGNSSSGTITLDPALSKLATGKLELEVAQDKPATPEGSADSGEGRDPGAGPTDPDRRRLEKAGPATVKSFVASLRKRFSDEAAGELREFIDPRYLKAHKLQDGAFPIRRVVTGAIYANYPSADPRTILVIAETAEAAKEAFLFRLTVYEGKVYILPLAPPDPETRSFEPWILRERL
jgi:hypothetical protein